MSVPDLCLIRSRGPSGEAVVLLGIPLVGDLPVTVRARVCSTYRQHMVTVARRTAVILLALSVIGSAVAVVLDLPAQFVSGTPDNEVGTNAVWEGTALSAPVLPLVVLLVGVWLTTRAGWQAVLGAVLLALVGAVMTIGGVGEWSKGLPFSGADTVVFVLFNVVGLGLSITLVGTAVASLVRRGGERGSHHPKGQRSAT